MNHILYYLVLINVITFLIYGIDKLKAKKGKWRIPEATLLILAILGGSIFNFKYHPMSIHYHHDKSSAWSCRHRYRYSHP